MNEETINLEQLPGEILAIHLAGKWQLGKDVPSAENARAELIAHPTAKESIYAFFFNQKGLMAGLGLQGSKITRITPDQ